MVSNSADPRIWVPKASGLGYTLNFAHPMAWVVFGATLALIAVLLYFKYRRPTK